MVRVVLKSLGGVLFLAAAYVAAIQLMYAGKVMPGVHSGALNLAGRTEADAKAVLAEQMNYRELTYTTKGGTVTVPAAEVGLAGDPDATAKDAVAAGHGQGWGRLTAPFSLLVSSQDIPRRYQLNEGLLRQKFADRTKELGQPTENAKIVRQGTEFRISKERAGNIVDPAANLAATKRALADGQTSLPLYIRTSQPAITANTLTPAKAYAEALAKRPVMVVVGDRTFEPSPETVAGWITFGRRDRQTGGTLLQSLDLISRLDEKLGIGTEDRPILAGQESTLFAEINREPVGIYVNELAGEVDKPPVNARVGFENDKLTMAGQPVDGLVLDRVKAVDAIVGSVAARKAAVLPVVAKPAEIREDTLASLGITTRIGASTTTFGGSPNNRVFNIGVGAARFDGYLIKPGEEFSFNDVLGDVGPETGYRPELVIKENKTVPEYGGGLCQVSTTMFRAAMDAGLPITARTNHSYAVHYYAPIGMDATIYPPNPDLKWRNNTGGYVLVQTARVGVSVTFELFGKSDARTSRTEIIHINASEASGGTASFRYVVEGGPDPINRVFSSSYRPQKDFPIGRSLN